MANSAPVNFRLRDITECSCVPIISTSTPIFPNISLVYGSTPNTPIEPVNVVGSAKIKSAGVDT